MISKYGVNQFKFDGTGNASTVFPGSLFDSDFSAMIHLIGELRLQEPNIFIDLTTGDPAFAVLAAVFGLHLARWRGPHFRRRWQLASEMDHLPRRRKPIATSYSVVRSTP